MSAVPSFICLHFLQELKANIESITKSTHAIETSLDPNRSKLNNLTSVNAVNFWCKIPSNTNFFRFRFPCVVCSPLARQGCSAARKTGVFVRAALPHDQIHRDGGARTGSQVNSDAIFELQLCRAFFSNVSEGTMPRPV